MSDHYPYPTSFAIWLDAQLDEGTAEVCENLFLSDAPAERLAMVLSYHGCQIGATTIRTWRRQNRLWKELQEHDDTAG